MGVNKIFLLAHPKEFDSHLRDRRFVHAAIFAEMPLPCAGLAAAVRAGSARVGRVRGHRVEAACASSAALCRLAAAALVALRNDELGSLTSPGDFPWGLRQRAANTPLAFLVA